MTAQELKNSILQMAIQGKLVKQDPNDEPASVLLDKIKEERDKLIKEKKIKKEKYSEIYKDPSDNHYYEKFEDGKINDITEEIPFEIPESWLWMRLGSACPLSFSGKSPKYTTVTNNNYVLGQKNNQPYGIDLSGIKYCTDDFIKTYPKELYVKYNDIFLNTLGGGTVGRIGIFNISNNNNYITDGHIFVFRTFSIISEEYMYYYLKSMQKQIEKDAEGTTNQMFLKLNNVKKYLVAVPPKDEQIRIINKLSKLEQNIFKYDDFHKRIENLNNNYREELKKSILQYAIQGKLVKQNSDDEPAQKLIEKILDEKRKLIKEKKIKKENLSVIYKDPSDNQFYEKFDDGSVVKLQSSEYDIPNNWCLARISQISSIVTKQTGFDYSKHIKPNLVTIKKENNLPMIQTKNFKGELFNLNTDYYIPIDIAKNFPKILLDSKCLLLSIVGASIGNIGIFSNKELCFLGGAICKVKLINEEMYKYLYYFLQSPQGYKEIMKNYKSTAQGTITVQDVRDIIIPMPPAKEQQRIVAKIDELFSLL